MQPLKLSARRWILGPLAVAAAMSALSSHAATPAPCSQGCTPQNLVRAETEQGVVAGESLGKVVAFLGIPYAAAPVGARRFKPPQPPAKWAGTKPALDMGPACPQLIDSDPTENSESVMAEDCLSLNIWTPRADAEKRPVMFWIHGGAFVVGSARNTWYNGAHLSARGDVVVVSINYRLGAWGFLSLGSFDRSYSESANVGLLDQVAALNWVRRNIANFGGDPDNVTIFGESAGASSVGDLLAMPAAKGLFAKAILESGLPARSSANEGRQQSRLAAEFMKLLGVRTPSELSKKSMADLLEAQEKLFSAHDTEIGTFGPSLDGVVLKELPYTILAQGRGSRVPILIGTTLQEMRYFSTAEDLGIERKPRKLLLSQLRAVAGPRAPGLLNVYQRLYPHWGDAVVQIASDAIERVPSIRFAERLSTYEPVYMYLLTYISDSTYKNFGSSHAMDLPFVFGNVDFPEVIVFTGRDPHRCELADKVMDSWAAFARTGNPTPPSGPAWPTYDSATRTTMELGTTLRTVEDPLAAQRKVWDNTDLFGPQVWKLLLVNH
jgi:para-nitrobenzyl esterase